MSQMHLGMYIIFALQLALLSIWIPQRCQNLLQPWCMPEVSTANKQRRWMSGLNLFLLSGGLLILLLGLTGKLQFLTRLIFVFTALQVLLLMMMRQWLPKKVATSSKRKASLQRRRVVDFITPFHRLLAILGLLSVPALSGLLLKNGLWTKDLAQLWQLCLVGILAQLSLGIAMYRAVFRHRHQLSETEAEQRLPLQQQIQHEVSTYLNAFHVLGLLLILLLLMGVVGMQPELLFIGISLLLQLILLQHSDNRPA